MLSDRTHIFSNYNQILSSYTFKFMIKKVLSKRSTFSYGIIEFEYCQYICKYFNNSGIYKLLDMVYTTLNVTGDITANILIDNKKNG